jgi:protein-S-isoprenylcysteine O-methyltransferase Ste14
VAWAPLAGIVLFLGVGIGWRSWLQARRYGSSGFLLFQSGRPSQHVRDALGVVLGAGLLGQALVAALAPYPTPSAGQRAIGVTLLFGGVVFLVTSQLNLGASWRIGIEEGARPGLVTDGIYAFCRNPIYLAMLITITGYGLLIPTRLSLAMLVGAFIGIRRQVFAEEAYLIRTYGDAFRAYASRVGRFLPGVGRLR